MHQTNRRLERIGPKWLLLLALAARLLYVLVSGTLFHPEPWEYEDTARALLDGEGFRYTHWGASYLAYSSSVLHPALAAFVYALTNGSQPAFVIVQAIISTLLVWVVYAVGTRTVGRPAAVLGAILAALHPPSLVYVGKLHPLGLDALMTTACVFGTLYLDQRRTLFAAVLLGALFGLGTLTRPTVIIFLPVALAWLLWRRQGPGGLRRLALVAAMAFALVAPWTARNAVVLGRPIFVSSTSSENFWLGNNPRWTGGAQTADRRPILEVAPEPFKQAIFAADEVRRYDLFEEDALRFIAADPLGFVTRTAVKFWYFWWFAPETGVLYEPLWLDVYRVLYGIGLALAIVGLWSAFMSRRAWERAAALLVFLFFMEIAAAQALFHVEGRHRWLLEPLLLLYSARGLLGLWDWVSRSAWGVNPGRPVSSPTE